MGNIGSIANMIKKAGGNSIISSNPKDILAATKLILPGVGSFDNGMKKLRDTGFADVLKEMVLVKKIPILGICLGMQLLTKSSEEGVLPGLGFVDAETVKFKFENIENGRDKLKIPHMGWNVVNIKKQNALLKDTDEELAFYFVHSYFVKCSDENDVMTTTNYGIEFVSSFNRENIFATQFHPEKSHKYGLNLMKNFCSLEMK
jgi:glutamine amidotransferase